MLVPQQIRKVPEAIAELNYHDMDPASKPPLNTVIVVKTTIKVVWTWSGWIFALSATSRSSFYTLQTEGGCAPGPGQMSPPRVAIPRVRQSFSFLKMRRDHATVPSAEVGDAKRWPPSGECRRNLGRRRKRDEAHALDNESVLGLKRFLKIENFPLKEFFEQKGMKDPPRRGFGEGLFHNHFQLSTKQILIN